MASENQFSTVASVEAQARCVPRRLRRAHADFFLKDFCFDHQLREGRMVAVLTEPRWSRLGSPSVLARMVLAGSRHHFFAPVWRILQ
jgi:hypothetical protein